VSGARLGSPACASRSSTSERTRRAC
jgi:hypothetical protein